ncbi:hypothetical protein CYY_002183 [Polysphondylium violaceum]|uniref:RRM domain-containing protein n=1 Tax=Polysphondylium violaceum TaxID=133409 RepID=A0A8J4PZT5_9MYCE|nr:hypothetical protein CYY_002183 [Polysphondylium violaceum]
MMANKDDQYHEDDEMEQLDGLDDGSSDSDDTSDDDSSSDDDENQHDTEHSSKAYEVDHLEIKLREDPYSFDKNIEFINALQGITKSNSPTSLERLRKARESFQSLFPLPEFVWVDWLSFEIKVSKTEQDYEYLDSLFEKAINDYISIKISIMYCSYKESIIFSKLSSGTLVIDSFSVPLVANQRDLFEKMIKKNGGDISEASKLWRRYIAFEKIVLSNLSDAKECAQSIKYINSLYLRLLSSTVVDLIDCFAEFKEWEHSKEIDDDYIEGIVEKSIQEVDARDPYEQAIATTDKQAAFPKWREYIEFEKKQTDNVRLTVAVYERAIKMYYSSIELWQGYLEYAQTNVSSVSQDILVNIHSRAVRNVYWSGDIWAGYMRVLERHSQSSETIHAVFERGLVAGLSSLQDCLVLYNALLDYQWRLVRAKSQKASTGKTIVDEQDIQSLQAIYQRACDYFAPLDAAILLDCQLYWANFQLESLGQWSEYVPTMETVLTYSFTQYLVWAQYIANTLIHATKEDARQLYQKAVLSVQDNAGKIWQDWLNFERQFGTLSQYEEALKQYHTATMKYLQQQQQHQTREQKGKPKAAKGKGQDKGAKANAAKEKPKRDRKRKSKKDDDGDDQDKANETNGNGKGGDVAMQVDKKPEQQQQEQEQEQEEEDKRKSKKIKTTNDDGGEKEICSIFVSSLPFETKEEEIQQLFGKYGEIKSIRLIRDKRGKSKGICFIDYSNTAEAKKSLELNGHMIDKFSLRVEYSKNNPPSVTKSTTTTTTNDDSSKIDYNNIEEKTVFINNLSPKITNELLEEYFTKNGILFSSVRVKNNKGARPFAYVDLVDKENLEKALSLNQKYFMGKSINVYVSKPPGSKSNNNSSSNSVDNSNSNPTTTSDVQFRKPTLLIPRGMLNKKK